MKCRRKDRRRIFAVAQTHARSVVMSAGGQPADNYHCMNMNETKSENCTRIKNNSRPRWEQQRQAMKRVKFKQMEIKDGKCGSVFKNLCFWSIYFLFNLRYIYIIEEWEGQRCLKRGCEIQRKRRAMIAMDKVR